MKSLTDKISYFFISFLMLAIVVAFTFTGFQGFSGLPGSIGSVDGTPITNQEFNQAYNQLLSRMSPNKSLTSKQIRDFGIRERALQSVIEQKHILNFASSLGFMVSPNEIKQEIKQLPYFKTGESFDVKKYKQLLAINKLTPNDFEEQIMDQVKTQRLQQLLSSGIYSDGYLKEKLQFQKIKASAWLVSYRKEDLVSSLEVSNSQIGEFLANEANQSTLESLYRRYKAETDMKKETAQPLEKVKNKLAKQHLQKSNRKELSELQEKVKAQIQTAFDSNNKRVLQGLKKKYGIDFQAEYKVSPLNFNLPAGTVDGKKITSLFKNKDLKTVIQEENQEYVTFLKVKKYSSEKVSAEELDKELKTSKSFGLFTLQSAILKHSKTHAKVVTKVNF